jgi:hypothetical protein
MSQFATSNATVMGSNRKRRTPMRTTPDLKPLPVPAAPGPTDTLIEWQQVRDALPPDLRAFLDSISDKDE